MRYLVKYNYREWNGAEHLPAVPKEVTVTTNDPEPYGAAFRALDTVRAHGQVEFTGYEALGDSKK